VPLSAYSSRRSYSRGDTSLGETSIELTIKQMERTQDKRDEAPEKKKGGKSAGPVAERKKAQPVQVVENVEKRRWPRKRNPSFLIILWESRIRSAPSSN
jgi:hypothetical protein